MIAIRTVDKRERYVLRKDFHYEGGISTSFPQQDVEEKCSILLRFSRFAQDSQALLLRLVLYLI